jgi:hypothetical protein|tara:strand:+ start:255 stop:461 length:207 start_codon:yes stop_codon:yes gene_type:complete
MEKLAQTYCDRHSQLIDEYVSWGIKNGFLESDLKSADEMRDFYPNLTIDQIIWLKEYSNQWRKMENGE